LASELLLVILRRIGKQGSNSLSGEIRQMDGEWLGCTAEGKSRRTVLLVSRFDQDRVRLRAILDRARLKLYTAVSVSEAIAILLDESIPVVICGGHIMGGDWRALWSSLRFLADRPNLIVSSLQADRQLWDEVLGLGGYAVVPAPLDATVVIPAIHLARSNWLHRRNELPAQIKAGKGVLAGSREFTLTGLTSRARSIGSRWLSSQTSWQAAAGAEKRAPFEAPGAGQFERIES
jgi:DNA-binding NarL/FixJ family response regulator